MSDYFLTPELETAITIALALNRPLLLTGEPGVGKSSLAAYLAKRDQLPYKKFVVKSDTKASDFFYDFDAVGRFASANMPQDNQDTARFVRFNALGWALLNTYPKAELVELSARVDLSGIAEDQPLGHTGQPNSVILVDEIDKAPRDVPNDLLDEFDHYAFTVKELTYNRMDYTVCHSFKAQNGIKPLLIMTSNDERGLPDAFLRRCIFHHIPVPPLASGAEDPEVTLDRILIEHAGHHWSQGGRLAKPFADLFKSLRDQPLKKYPGLSEMMWFLQALKGPGSNQHSRHELRQSALNVLFKSQQDQEIGKEAVDHFVNAVINSKNVD